MHTAQSLNNTDVATMIRVGRLTMVLIADVLAMVLISDVLALSMMIEQPERKQTTAMAMEV